MEMRAGAMNDTMSTDRFALRRIDARTWVIKDAPSPARAARVIARITITDDDIAEVAWAADLPLPTAYVAPRDALESLEAWAGPRGATKPIPIPHFPPPRDPPRVS